MTWTEGTWIIFDGLSITGGYCGILIAMFGIIVVISFIVSVALLMAWFVDTYF